MDLDIFYVFVQLAIAIAGFTGIVMILETKSIEFQRIRLIAIFHVTMNILIGSLAPIFFSRLFHSETLIWQLSSMVALLMVISFQLIVVFPVIRIGRSAAVTINLFVTSLIWGLGYISVIGLIFNVIGWPFFPNDWIYVFHHCFGVVMSLCLLIDVVLRSHAEIKI